MTLKYNVEEAESWDDEQLANVVSYIKARPWLQSDLDRISELRGEDLSAAPATASGNNYDDMTKDELQEELEARDLPVSGNKDELIARLQESDA